MAWRRAEQETLRLEARGLPGNGQLSPIHWDVPQPQREGDALQSERVLVAVAIRRTVYGELSLVALRAMRELAIKYDVPFDVIGDQDRRFSLPADIQPIAEKILAYALGNGSSLSKADNQLLHSRYIHLSANWTPTSGLLVNKPAPNRRLIFNNKPQEGYPE
ncbi:hypothetical protein D9M71_678210 [compost metagenome]